MPKDDVLLKRLLKTFKIEAQEQIQTIATGLVELEKAASAEAQAAVLDATFRSAHSLKGAARAVNAVEIESLCQSVESVFAALKSRKISPNPELFDVLHRATNALGTLLQFIDATPTDMQKPNVTGLTDSLQTVLTKKLPSKLQAPTKQPSDFSAPFTTDIRHSGPEDERETIGTVRVNAAKLDTVLLQAEELLASKLSAIQYSKNLRQFSARTSAWRKKWVKLRPDVRMLGQALEGKRNRNGNLQCGRQLSKILEFLEWNRDFVEATGIQLEEMSAMADHEQRSLGSKVDSLHDEMTKIAMQPFSTLLEVFPMFVRELSRGQGKEVELVIRGGDIKMDRRILEEMKDPLIHLVRNCLDHGIELPAERTQKGKPSNGTITIDISAKNGGSVELFIADDGTGIDANKVKSVAVKAALLAPEKATALDDKEALSFIFQSGVSTSPIITDISGRGLGLAIVKEKVEKLNGALSVETKINRGTTFRIILPLTLARFRGILVRVDEHFFVIPSNHVERVMRLKTDDVKTIENRETISLDNKTVALVRMGELLDISRKTASGDPLQVLYAVVLVSADQRIAFTVDEILNEQEVLVKTLGKQLARVRNIAGATVLGSGEVVPILNVSDLMKFAVGVSATGSKAPAPVPVEVRDTEKKSVLVAEDSITSRTLLKNIIETAGYQVETAVDGIDAFTKLRSGKFDLVVSDVDMPRMNGFGFTAKIRGDKKLAELPVILVTALESREDREHGIDVGANAYLVKSSFDQSNLLETIRRLL